MDLRVLKSARAVFSGSPPVRQKMATQKTEQFFHVIENIISKQGYVSKSQIEENLAALAPGVKFRLGKTPINPERWGGIESIYGNQRKEFIDAISEFYIDLPFNKKGHINKNWSGILYHEAGHFFDGIFMPKITARTNLAKFYGYEDGFSDRIIKYRKFYSKELYSRGFVKSSSEKQLSKIENKINKLFAETKPQEKIEILQFWRHALMTEKNSFNDAVKFDKMSHKSVMGKIKKFLDKPIQETPKDKLNWYAFDEKLGLLNKLLGQEIKSERKKLKNLYA